MEMARIAKALADPHRCEILERLGAAELCCSDLEAIMPLSQATISHHLSKLHAAGLITMRAEGTAHYYRLNPEGLRAINKSLLSPAKLARAPAVRGGGSSR